MVPGVQRLSKTEAQVGTDGQLTQDIIQCTYMYLTYGTEELALGLLRHALYYGTHTCTYKTTTHNQLRTIIVSLAHYQTLILILDSTL